MSAVAVAAGGKDFRSIWIADEASTDLYEALRMLTLLAHCFVRITAWGRDACAKMCKDLVVGDAVAFSKFQRVGVDRPCM